MKKWREREKEMGNAFETSLGFFNGKWERDPRWVIMEEKIKNKKIKIRGKLEGIFYLF